MAYRAIILDVDGVIAEVGKPVRRETAEKLVGIEKRGLRIILASGKNVSYLLGLARGIGILKPIVIGENGCIIFDLEAMNEYRLANRPGELIMLEKLVIERYNGSIWLQPNQIQLTIFPKEPSLISDISRFIDNILSEREIGVLQVFVHKDAIDILPRGINKGIAVERLMSIYNLSREELIAVGDAESDIPMLRTVSLPICIGERMLVPHCKRFRTIIDALEFVEGLI